MKPTKSTVLLPKETPDRDGWLRTDDDRRVFPRAAQ